MHWREGREVRVSQAFLAGEVGGYIDLLVNAVSVSLPRDGHQADASPETRGMKTLKELSRVLSLTKSLKHVR